MERGSSILINLTGGKVDETIGLSDGGGIVPPTNISSSD